MSHWQDPAGMQPESQMTDVLVLHAQFGKHWLVMEEPEEEGNTDLWKMPSFFCS